MDHRLFVVMGVAGSGKSSIGAGVAEAIGGTYLDGDDFHPKTNVEKMSRGEPLTDDDRWPWLKQVAHALVAQSGTTLIGCSALKRVYRDLITREAGEPVRFIYLDGSKELIASRMAARTGHFMPTSLLESQFDALEVPGADEDAVHIDISGTEAEVVALIVEAIGAKQKVEGEI